MFSSVLTDKQVDRLHSAALTILERTGVHIPHTEMLNRFADAGAQVDHNFQHVRIPPEVVSKSLEQSGKQFTLYGRDLDLKAEFGFGKRNYNSSAGQALWVDSLGEERRYATMADVETATRFGDAIESINIVGAMADPHEMPVASRCVAVTAEMLKQTTKPIAFWYHDRASARYINEIVIALRGDEERATQYPVCLPLLEPISPLRFPFHGVDLLFETARLNMPVPIGPMAQMGISAPATIAGTIAQEHAEILAGICVTQIVHPGTPVLYGAGCHAFDMRTTQTIFSGPEQAIFGVAMTQMGKSLGIPVAVNTGLTDSKCVDAQAGLEAGITLSLAAAAGADIFGHFGICGVDQAASLEMLVMQDEIIAYIERLLREIDTSDEKIGLDVIENLEPGTSFLDTEHTVEHFRSEIWMPRLLDRQYYQSWLDDGATEMATRCRKRTDQILRSHKPQPMDEDLVRALDEIVASARRHLEQ